MPDNAQDRPTIGFIGLGATGAPTCGRIIDAGYPVWVYDIRPDRAEPLVSRGARRARDICEIGRRATQIVLMLPGNRDAAHVVDQLLPWVGPSTVIIDMSTVDPSISVTLAAKVEAVGGNMVDAPVVRRSAAAGPGQIGVLLGGKDHVVARVQPLLASVGHQVIHMGPNGSGLAMKLCHDVLVAQIQNGVNEMLVLARAYGLGFPEVVRAVSSGSGQNHLLDTRAGALRTGDFSENALVRHLDRGLGLAARLCRRLGIQLPGLSHARRVYRAAVDGGYATRDLAAVIRVTEGEATGAAPEGWDEEITRTDMNVHNIS